VATEARETIVSAMLGEAKADDARGKSVRD